jgi:hypothetical protein
VLGGCGCGKYLGGLVLTGLFVLFLVFWFAGSPFDVLGTRLMQKEAVLEGKGIVQFTKDIVRQEGVFGFYKGGSINLARLWGFNLTLWLGYENIKKKVAEWDL